MTTEPTLKNTVAKEFLLAAMDREIRYVNENIAEFADVARVHVLTVLRGAVERSEEAEVPKTFLTEIATREALRGATKSERSASTTWRLMTECVTEAWGDLANNRGMQFFEDALFDDPEFNRQSDAREAWRLQQEAARAKAERRL